jgi:hypothetical protein
MIRTLRRSGSSIIITIPKELIFKFHAEPGDLLDVPDEQIKIIKRNGQGPGQPQKRLSGPLDDDSIKEHPDGGEL